MTILVNLPKLVLIALTVSKPFGDDFDNTITNNSDEKDFDINIDIKKKKSLGKEVKNKLTLQYNCKNNLNDKEVKHDVKELAHFLKRTFDRSNEASKYSSQDADVELNTVNECIFEISVKGAMEFSDYKDEIVKEFEKQVKEKKQEKKAGSKSNIPDGMKQEMDNMVDILITIDSASQDVDKKDVGSSGKMLVTLLDSAEPEQINHKVDSEEDISIDTIASVGDITANLTGNEKTVAELVKKLEEYSDLKVKLGVTFELRGEITQEQLNDISDDVKGAIASVSSQHIDGTPISGKLLLYRDWNKWTSETEEDLKEQDEIIPEEKEKDENSKKENEIPETEDSEKNELLESISPSDFRSNGSQSGIVASIFFFIL